MKKWVYISLIFLIATSCQIEEDGTPAPDDSFIKYYGELTSYVAKDIEIIYDETGENALGLVILGTKQTARGDNDYFVMRTDLSGNLIDSVSFGFLNQTELDFTGDGEADAFIGNEIAGQIHSANNIFLVVGSSSITETIFGIADWRLLTISFLDAEFQFLGETIFPIVAEDDNTALDLIGNDVISLSDGSILIVGAKEMNRGGGVTDFDNYFLKFNLNTGIIFEQTQGVIGQDRNEQAVRAFEKANGNLVIIGYGNTPSGLGENGGNNGINVHFLELDPQGTPVNSEYYGIDDPANNIVYNDIVNNAIATTSGFAITGTSNTSQDQNFGFVMNLTKNGAYVSGNTLPSGVFFDASSSPIETRLMGITQTLDNDMVLVGQYPNFNTTVNGQAIAKSGEGLFMKADQSSNLITSDEKNYGLIDGNDEIVDAVTLPDGKIVALANIDFGAGVRLISLIKLNDTGNLVD